MTLSRHYRDDSLLSIAGCHPGVRVTEPVEHLLVDCLEEFTIGRSQHGQLHRKVHVEVTHVASRLLQTTRAHEAIKLINLH